MINRKIKGIILASFFFLTMIMGEGAMAYPVFTPNSDIVRVAPYGQDATIGGGNWGSVPGQFREFINIGHTQRIRQNGTIEQVRLYTANQAPMTEFYIKIWRKNGTTYDLVGTSNDILADMVTGEITTITLSSPIAGVEEGDYIGYRMAASASNTMHAVVGGTSIGTTSRYLSGIEPGTNYDWDNSVQGLGNVVMPIEIFMQAPQAVFIGDSIISGAPFHSSFLRSIDKTDIDSTIQKQFTNITGYSYQNMGIGSQTTNSISTRFTSDVINLNPKLVLVEGGVNDIAGGTITKAQFLANNIAMLDSMDAAGITALMLKILPWTNGSDAQSATIDEWNADLETLVNTYANAFIVDAGAYVGEFNSAGPADNYWDIQAIYGTDGVHFNQAGHTKIAEAIADTLRPIATFDNDFTALEGGEIPVNYNLRQIGINSIQNISQTASGGIEYSTNSGTTWFDATDAGGTSDGLLSLTGSQAGINHDFLWDAETDLGIGTFTGVLLRIKPNDGTVDALDWVVSNAIPTIDTVAPVAPTVGVLSPNPASTGTTVTLALTGVGSGATATVPGMTCNPSPADSTGIVNCTAVAGVGLLDGSNNTVTVTDGAGNTNNDMNVPVLTVSGSSRGGGGGGGGGGSSSVSSATYCRDVEASNYKNFGTADNSKCEYIEEETEVIIIEKLGSTSKDEINFNTEKNKNDGDNIIDKGLYIISNDTCITTNALLDEDYIVDYKTNFNDISPSKYFDEIQRLEKNGIVKGRKSGLFSPNSEITRAEFLAIVLQSHCYDISEKPSTLPFVDIDVNHWHGKVIKTALESNIIAGDMNEAGERIFRGNDPISKIEAFAILINMRELTLTGDVSKLSHTYTDIETQWQNTYIITGEQIGILNPNNDETLFFPNKKVFRGELIGLMFDVMELY